MKKNTIHLILTLILLAVINNVFSQESKLKMTWDYTTRESFKLDNLDSITIDVFVDSILINKLNFNTKVFYLADTNKTYNFKINKPGYYSHNYIIDTKGVDLKKISIYNKSIFLKKVNPSLPAEKYSPNTFEKYIYNLKKNKFILDFEYGRTRIYDFMKFSKLNTLLSENKVLQKEFDNYIEQVRLSEKKIQEEQYNNYQKEKENERQAIELEKTKLIAEQKENELQLKQKENEIQKLKLTEKQSKIYFQELENIKNSKKIEVLKKSELVQLLLISKKEIELNKTKLENTKKEAELKLSKQNQQLKNEEIKRQKNIRNFSILGLIFIVFVSLFILKSLYENKKKNKIITIQKKLVEEKNSEIIASIRYAKRIQDAYLTSQKYIERNIIRLKQNSTSEKS